MSQHSDLLDLKVMDQISITNIKLTYGINVDSLFWVSNNILTRDQVRESRDEELIADLIAYTILNPKPPSNPGTLNEYYGITKTSNESDKSEELESAIKKNGEEEITRRYLLVHNELRLILKESGKSFNKLMFDDAGIRVPRYFQIVFLALYHLLIEKNMQPKDYKSVSKKLRGIGNTIKMTEGGNWSAENRQTSADAVVGVIKSAFKKRNQNDPALDSWVTELENIFTQSKTENSLYDLKQGLQQVIKPYSYDDGMVDKIAKTLAAMANNAPGAVGYVIVGATDEEATATKIISERSITGEKFNNFFILGIDHEAKGNKKGIDGYFQKFLQDFKTTQISENHKNQILRDIRMVSYMSKHLIVLKVTSDEPCTYDNSYFERHGPHIQKIEGEALKNLFARFYKLTKS